MVLALQVSTSGFARRAARFSPLRLLLLKTAIPATAPCVHEMDTLICKLAGAVRIENNADRNFKDLEEMLGNAKVLIRNNGECTGILIGPSMAPCFFESVKFVRHGFPLLPYVACRLRA